MNFTLDGVPTSFLLHTVQQVQDGGSIAMLNGDILDGITLLNGSYPQRYGNRLGAELDFHMREGSRDRTQTQVRRQRHRRVGRRRRAAGRAQGRARGWSRRARAISSCC